jgi:protein TonB
MFTSLYWSIARLELTISKPKAIMEPKKNPVYDIHRYRSGLFSVGLVTSIAIVIMAFEWKAVLIPPQPRKPDPSPAELIFNVHSTDHVYETKVKHKAPVTPLNFVEVKEAQIDNPDDVPVFNNQLNDVVTIESVDIPEDVPEEPRYLIMPEVMPEPASGYNGFYELLRKSLRYPKKAQLQEIEGKVFIQFIVGENGELTDLHVIKGIGAGCDEEAVRVLKLSKWKPGKQRGKPVKVKMVLPIHFKLNHQ